MTSKKSSLNPMKFTYFKALKKSIPVLALLFFTLIEIAFPVFAKINAYKQALQEKDILLANYLKTQFKFLFGTKMIGDEFSYVSETWVEIVMLGAALILAVGLFGYMLIKQSVNVTFSLGISKEKYFLARYLAGATIIVSGVVIPMIIGSIANAAFYGNSKELWIAAGYFSIKIISSILWTFTCFAFVTVLVGTIFEAIVIGTVVVFSPVLVNGIVSTLMSISAFGSPYISTLYDSNLFWVYQNGKVVDSTFNLFDFYKYLTPINNDTAMFYNLTYDGKYEFEIPSFKWPLFFLVIIIALAAVTYYLCSKRKAEKAGFMGSSPFIQGYCVLTVGPYLGFFMNEIYSASRVNFFTNRLILLGAAVFVMAVGYSVVDLICMRSFKKYAKRLKYLGIEVAIFIVIALSFTVVLTARYSKVPEKESIKSVSVSVPEAMLTSENKWNVGIYADEDVKEIRLDDSLTLRSDRFVMIGDFTSEDMIDLVTKANKEIVSFKKTGVSEIYDMSEYGKRTVPYYIRITYTLKNGKTISRLYTIASDDVICSLTDAIISSENAKKYAADNVFNSQGSIALISADGLSASIPDVFNNFESPENDEVKKAISDDILEGNLPLNYKSDSELIGYITTNASADSDFFAKDKAISMQIEYDFSCYQTYPVYASMKNTIAVLEKYGVMDLFEHKAEPVKITYIKYNSGTDTYRLNTVVGIENGIVISNSEVVTNVKNKLSDDAIVVTDKEMMTTFAENTRFVSYTIYDGYFVMIEYDNGMTAFGYIPACLMK